MNELLQVIMTISTLCQGDYKCVYRTDSCVQRLLQAEFEKRELDRMLHPNAPPFDRMVMQCWKKSRREK